MSTAKSLLRKSMKKTLSSLSKDEVVAQSRTIVDRVLSLPEWTQAKIVSIYISTDPGSKLVEVNTDALIQTALKDGKKVIVPHVAPPAMRMKMVELQSLEDLKDNFVLSYWGIKELSPNLWQTERFETTLVPDLVIVPGTAFSRGCRRCGRGKGHYDEYFTVVRNAKKVAVAFNEQILEENDIPLESHDVLLDRVVTPTGVYGTDN
eukprot:PhF_6_TR42547/c0_g1_i1/m.64030/K01934/MTHFS; 5-formyltetrahydrofolate cyclo-ligase